MFGHLVAMVTVLKMKPKPRGMLDLHKCTLGSRRVRREFENVSTLKQISEDNVLRECLTRRGERRCVSAAVQNNIIHENLTKSLIETRCKALESQENVARKFEEDVRRVKESEEIRKKKLRVQAERQLLFNSSQKLQEQQLKMRCVQNAKELSEQIARRKAEQNERKMEKESEQLVVRMKGGERVDALNWERTQELRRKYKEDLEAQILWKEGEIENERERQMGETKGAMTANVENRRSMNNYTDRRKQLRESIDEFLDECAACKRKERYDALVLEERVNAEAKKKVQWEESLQEMCKEKIQQRRAIQREAEKLLQEAANNQKRLVFSDAESEELKRNWEMDEKKKHKESVKRRQELQESFLAQIKNREIQLLKEIMDEERYEAKLREKQMSEDRDRKMADIKRRSQQKGLLDSLQLQMNDLLSRRSREKEREIEEFTSRMRNLEMQDALINKERNKMVLENNPQIVKFPRLTYRTAW